MNEYYEIFNKTYQPIILIDGVRILPRKTVLVAELTSQLVNLEKKGLISIKRQ